MIASDVRSDVIIRRTYNRPKDDGTFESWEETVDRVINHQEWLWSDRDVGQLQLVGRRGDILQRGGSDYSQLHT